MILGHAHPPVVEALREAAVRGTSFGAATPGEVDLAEEIASRTPVEMVRLVNSGTEATMSALRLARGFTGRPAVVKFGGCYHGHVDALLASAGSGVATFALPDSPGVTGLRPATRSCCPTTTRTRSGGVRRPRGRDRLRDHGGVRREHGRRAAGARVQRAALVAVPRAWRAADHGRGADRLPGHPVGVVRARRRGRGSDDVRQGHGGRAARGGVRRAGRDHVAAGPGGARLPGRNAVG